MVKTVKRPTFRLREIMEERERLGRVIDIEDTPPSRTLNIEGPFTTLTTTKLKRGSIKATHENHEKLGEIRKLDGKLAETGHTVIALKKEGKTEEMGKCMEECRKLRKKKKELEDSLERV